MHKKSELQENLQLTYCFVGTTRFELATPCTPCKCATGLRYVPNRILPSKYGVIGRVANIIHFPFSRQKKSGTFSAFFVFAFFYGICGQESLLLPSTFQHILCIPLKIRN